MERNATKVRIEKSRVGTVSGQAVNIDKEEKGKEQDGEIQQGGLKLHS